jgi:hypothetical protein
LKAQKNSRVVLTPRYVALEISSFDNRGGLVSVGARLPTILIELAPKTTNIRKSSAVNFSLLSSTRPLDSAAQHIKHDRSGILSAPTLPSY